MAEKIVAIIPAHNEAQTIGPLLESLQRIKAEGIIHEIKVIDDGSTDKTAEIAKTKGAEVVRIEKNSGKAFAFYKGAQEAKKQGATILVTLDADLKPVSIAQITKLVRPVLKERKTMSIGMVSGDSTSYSGQRAIKMNALEPLLNGNTKWETYFGIKKGNFKRRAGYSLEMTLNYILAHESLPWNPKNPMIAVTNTNFEPARRAFQKTPYEKMHLETSWATLITGARAKKAAKLWQSRKKSPAKAKEHLQRMRKRRQLA